MAGRTPFESATALVEAWLDSEAGSSWTKRDARLRGARGAAWDIDLQDESLPIKSVRLSLPPDFPASPCELHVGCDRFLQIPHVESDGRLCLGIESIPNDYDDPVGAVARAIETLKTTLLGPATDPGWVAEQFHAERTSYWSQHCKRRREARDHRPVPTRTYVDVRALGSWARGATAAYTPAGTKHRRYSLQVVACGDTDPHELATRHRWSEGARVKGDALLVRLPSDMPWTPQTWPLTFAALDALVARVTDNEVSVSRWLGEVGFVGDKSAPVKGSKKARRRQPALAPPGQRPLVVVLVQDGVHFGYQVYAPPIALLTPPAVEPLYIMRVDPDWALARDYGLPTLHRRRSKRVLLIGAGSLGSPVAHFLARGGIGNIDIVDAQLMESENTGRHELGFHQLAHGKASALATELTKAVPGLRARGFVAEATSWASKNCRPGAYDLVVECTAESAVRTFLSHMRFGLLGSVPVLHAWTEPLCSAAHVVLSQAELPWPPEDPADDLVNASDLSAHDTRVTVAACSGGFHPYGAADIAQVAAFVAERLLAVVDEPSMPSTVWSWVRSTAFFDSLGLPVETRSIVPTSSSKFDALTTTRLLKDVLRTL